MRSRSVTETMRLAHQFALRLRGGDIVALIGPLGAGKTTFVQGLARALGIKKLITSPTFILLKSYRLNKPFHHIIVLTHVDCYRLHNAQQLIDVGIQDHFDNPHTITVIEWADRMISIIPSRAYWITFSFSNTDQGLSRAIIIDK
ncbi:MAG: tRNA (adenosine(37)-N6)-threonylcarbamoyltransferase complex ATPase subunit type 1 TsaE [Patescibacteria group bacterium]